MMEAGIRFELDYRRAMSVPGPMLREIGAWRRMLYLNRLIGREPWTYGRYGGIGYGNISRRVEPWEAPPEERRFIVSGTRTGCLPALEPRHYATVVRCVPERNFIAAEGPVEPSSEALTHGTLYGLSTELRWVMHVHSPEIWGAAESLGLPITRRKAEYGTPEMAAEVRRLYLESDLPQRRIFAMGGHQDGVVSFGRTAEQAGTALLATLARAFQVDGA